MDYKVTLHIFGAESKQAAINAVNEMLDDYDFYGRSVDGNEPEINWPEDGGDVEEILPDVINITQGEMDEMAKRGSLFNQAKVSYYLRNLIGRPYPGDDEFRETLHALSLEDWAPVETGTAAPDLSADGDENVVKSVFKNGDGQYIKVFYREESPVIKFITTSNRRGVL